MPTPTEYLIPSQAAKILGVSVRRIHQLVDSGSLPAIRAGGIRLIKPADVEIERKRRAKASRQDRASA